MPVLSHPDIDRPGEEPLLPQAPSERSFFLGPIPGTLHHPWTILGWQLSSCASAWSFVIALARNGEIPLSDALASLVSRYQTETTIIATLLATMLSAATTWFFHAAIRQAVVPFLLRRVSLFQLRSAIEFSMGSVVLNKHNLRWTVLTLLCAGLHASLTSAWSSIITPITIDLDLQVTGQEFDVSTLAFMNLMGSGVDNQLFLSPMPALQVSLSSTVQITAAVSSVIGGFGYTSIVPFINGVYNISTGGIIPIDNPMIPTIESWSSTATSDIYPRVAPIGSNYYHGSSINQTINQQGLTANVSCRSQNLSDPTSFPYIVISYSTSNVSVSGLDFPYLITSWSWNTTCLNNFSSYTNSVYTFGNIQDDPGLTFLAGSICPLQGFSGPSNQSFLIALEVFDGLSDYSGSQLCEVTPLLTTVQVEYRGDIMNVGKTLSSSTFDQIDPSGSMVYKIGQQIGAHIYTAELSNVVGNPILNNIDAFVIAQPINLTEATWELIFEDYWRGSVEALITEFRLFAVLSLNSTQIPANMSVSVNGTMHVTTMGWRFSKIGSLIALLPITATFLLSVLALLLPRSWQHHGGSPQNTADERIIFDPSSIMSIIRASAAGGMSHFFRGLRTPESTADEEAHFLSIGLTNDNQIGFVESETHSLYCAQAGKQHLESTTSTMCGPSGPPIMDTVTCSATLDAEDNYPASVKVV